MKEDHTKTHEGVDALSEMGKQMGITNSTTISNITQAPYGNGKASDQEMLTLSYQDGSSVVVPVLRTVIGGATIKSISKITPIGKSVLLAEMGIVGMLELLNYARKPQEGLAVPAKLIIVGVGEQVPMKFPLGSIVIAKNKDQYNFRDVHDPQNSMSFDALIHHAQKDKDLLAAMAIVNNKDMSKVGLNMDFTTPSMEVLNEMNEIKSKGNMGNLLYKDKKLKFVNFKLMDYTNIDAIINA